MQSRQLHQPERPAGCHPPALVVGPGELVKGKQEPGLDLLDADGASVAVVVVVLAHVE